MANKGPKPGLAAASPNTNGTSSSSSSVMEETSQNGNQWPFSVRYTASPYRKAQTGKSAAVHQSASSSPYTATPHHHINANASNHGHGGHFDPGGLQGAFHHSHQQQQQQNVNVNIINQHLLLQHHTHQLQQQQQQQHHPHHHHNQSIQNLKQQQFEAGLQHHHFHALANNHHPSNSTNSAAQNHFLDLKQHQEHQQHLIHYRQRQYDHHHYGLPLNLNVAALPPEVLLQASQATLSKTMDMELQQQRFENLQNFHNLECMQQQIQTAATAQQQQNGQQNGHHNHLVGQHNNSENKIETVFNNGGENHHFRMRYPSITPRNRVLKLSGNCNSLEQVEGLDEGYIEELKIQPQQEKLGPNTNSSSHYPHPPPRGHPDFNQFQSQNHPPPHANLPQYDPYSYVYDAQTQLIKEDLSVCSASVNSYLNKKAAAAASASSQSYHPHPAPPSEAFFPYVQHTPQPQPRLNRLHHPHHSHLTHPHHGHHHRSSVDNSSLLENEYEEICDVQKYMNIDACAEFGSGSGSGSASCSGVRGLDFNPYPDDTKLNAKSSPTSPATDDKIGIVEDNPASSSTDQLKKSDVNLVAKVETAGTGEHSKQNSDLSLTSSSSHPLKNLVVTGPLPAKHFKSYSTSTDDILAEVVQVQQKHDRVLDQLNLEVENLLLNSSSAEFALLEDKDFGLVSHSKEGSGSGSYSTLFVSKDGPPPALLFNSSQLSNGSLPFRSAHSSANLNNQQNFGTINAFGTFSRKSKQGRGGHVQEVTGDNKVAVVTNSGGSDCKDYNSKGQVIGKTVLGSNKTKGGKMMNGQQSNGKLDCPNVGGSEEIFCGGGETKVKSKYQRSMSLIPNWKIRDHLMRLPFLRSNSQQDKVKKSEGGLLLPHSQSISGGDFPSLQQQQFNNKHGNNQCNNMNSLLLTEQQQQKQQASASTLLKNRASSVDELRSAGEEHWYSADSDTEPDSLTAIIPPIPPAHSPPGDPNQNNSANSPNVVNSNSVNLNLNGVNNVVQEKVNLNLNYQLKGQTFPFVQSVGNLYSNCGESNGSRMDVATIGNGIPDVQIPKAPKFRRPSTGLKDKWRESWSSSSSNPKSLLKSTSMEEENRLLRWFSLRKNSASANLDGSYNNHSSNGSNRHSTTLPQLTEEDLKRISFMEDEEGYWPRRTVQPPSLPPPPPDLTGDQITRRHIVAAIVHSENSYVAALQRLVNEYKKPLECSHPAILSHSKISAVFHRVPEILQCHSLFRIALAECVRKWDGEEKIGDVFVASFSKSLVLDVYSEFINNFGTAMETAKSEARRKSAFAEFLKVKQMTAHDRLSLFGLMVKPVQRFPQFILLLQDLLKHTPKDHHDRMSLQLALTQLESLAAMLNERKRESEQYQAFRETIKSIGGGKFVLLRSIVDDPNRILLRQDLVTQLEFDNYGSTVGKQKTRKLLLLNDMLICTTVTGTSAESATSHSSALSRKESIDDEPFSNGRRKSEKSVFKWSFPVRDVEVEDISISPTMSRFVHNKSSASSAGSKNSTTTTTTEESSMSITLLEEMQCLMHDYEVLSRILTSVSTLKSTYDGLSVSSVKDLMLEIQHQIRCRDEQISYFDSSCLTLLLGSGTGGHNKEKVVFQMQSPVARSAWIEELRLAQLALDPNNSPAWDIPLESPYPLHKLPLFVKAVPLSKQPHLTVVKCGCFFTHTFVSQTGRSKILDYLWVSSTDGMSSHLTAFRSQQNTLKEVSSLDLVEEKVNDMVFVQGYMWVATESRKIMIYDPADTEKGPIAQQILTDAVLKLLFYNNTIFAGLADGHLAIFVQLNFESESLEKFCPEILLQLGTDRIVALFGSREHIYAACGSSIVQVNSTTFTVEKSVLLNHHNGPISHMTCSGVGLWITTHESETVCLYHLESFQHLQDVSIRPSVYRTVRDSYRRSKGVSVTCLIAHKGWLWIGTNLGVILTIPLPRLEGVPIISTGNANVSYHGFCGPVTFLMPLMKSPIIPALLPPSSKKSSGKPTKSSVITTTSTPLPDKTKDETDHNPATQVQNPSNDASVPSIKNEQEEDHPLSSSTIDNSHTPPPEPCLTTPLTIEVLDVPDKAITISSNKSPTAVIPTTTAENTQILDGSPMSPPTTNGVSVNLRSRKRKDRDRGSGGNSHNNSSSSTSSIENSSSPSPNNSGSALPGGAGKTLVVLRKKSSKDSLVQSRNCKTLPRGGTHPSNLRFSIDSDVYGLYGNLINVRGLEDEGRFVDPLYDALRRSDPELNSLDAKISTLDRRLKMRMSRPRSLDLSNWSVDSKISASSDDSSLGLSSSNNKMSGDFTHHHHHVHTPSDSSPTPPNSRANINSSEIDSCSKPESVITSATSSSLAANTTTTTGRSNNNNKNRQKTKTGGPQQERTVLVVVGGRGYLNARAMGQDNFISTTDTEAKSCPHLTLWQMKT